jgi:uncharacterized membrane protein
MGNVIIKIVNLVAMFTHLAAIIVIAIGIIKAFLIFIVDVFSQKESRKAIKESRLEIGHAFSLGLGFLIGASILKTTIAPTWNDIGQLASIIAIRTLLNYFLIRDINQMSNGESR